MSIRDPFAFVDDIINEKNIKKAGNFITQVLTIAFGIIAGVLLTGSAAFLIPAVLSGNYLLLIPALLLLGPGIVFLVITFNFRKSGKKVNYSKQNNNDLKACKDILDSVKKQLKSKNIDKKEIKYIYGNMEKEYKEAKALAGKMSIIENALKSPDYDLNKIEKRIEEEKNKQPVNDYAVKTLEEQKKNIEMLRKKLEKLRQHIPNLRLSFNNIFTKITLLDTNDSKKGYDGIETEIQRILDFKLNIQQFEENLDKELS